MQYNKKFILQEKFGDSTWSLNFSLEKSWIRAILNSVESSVVVEKEPSDKEKLSRILGKISNRKFVNENKIRFFIVDNAEIEIWLQEYSLDIYSDLTDLIFKIEDTLPHYATQVRAHQGREIPVTDLYTEVLPTP